MDTTVDPEIQAIALLGEAFDGLTDTAARSRVIQWAVEKYEISATVHSGAPMRAAADSQSSSANSKAEGAKPKRKAKSKRVRAESPSIRADLKFDQDSGDYPELREYFWGKFPEGKASHPAAFAVIAHWLRECAGIGEVGIDEMYTAYRWLQLKMPKVWRQAFRDGKSKMAFFVESDQKGYYALTHIAEDAIFRGDLGKGAKIARDTATGKEAEEE